MPQVEKSDGYIHVFMCKQASGSRGNFSWRHMQNGSRYPPKPGVVITRRRKDISTWSQRLRHTFWACPIHLHLRQPRPTMENAIRCKPEVETVSQTGSTINLATETDIDVISVSIPMFFCLSVSVAELLVLPVWCYVSTSGLYLMLFSEVGQRQYRWKWIGHARKLRRSRLHHVYISSLLFPSPTYNYFRFASAILNLQV